MDVTTFVAEVLFVLLFVATFIEFVRHRDPVRRDIMLVFSGLALLDQLMHTVGSPACVAA